MGDAKWCGHNALIHQKVKYRLTEGSSDSPWGTHPTELKAGTQRDYLYTHVHRNIIHKRQKEEVTEVATEEQVNTRWYIHKVEYYLALKKNGILTHAIAWMNLEDIDGWFSH